jgi:hypothetical protein
MSGSTLFFTHINALGTPLEIINTRYLTNAAITARDPQTWNTPFHAALLKLEELLKQDQIESRTFDILLGYIDFFIEKNAPCYQMNLKSETVCDIYARLPESKVKARITQSFERTLSIENFLAQNEFIKTTPTEALNGDPVAILNLSVLLINAHYRMPINGVETTLAKIFKDDQNFPRTQQRSFTFLNHTMSQEDKLSQLIKKLINPNTPPQVLDDSKNLLFALLDINNDLTDSRVENTFSINADETIIYSPMTSSCQ